MKILSIDPGYERLGIAVLHTEQGKNSLLYSDCFMTSSKLPHYRRLSLIGEEIARVVAEWKPDTLATEDVFFNKNIKTALLVSQALGVVVYEATRNKIKAFQYSPLEVKMAVCGYGRATKDQIIMMVPKLVQVRKKIEHDDEFDAIAIGLTHAASYKSNAIRTPLST